MRNRRRTFLGETFRNLKSNLQCVFCKEKDCKIRFDVAAREEVICNTEMNKRINKAIKRK